MKRFSTATRPTGTEMTVVLLGATGAEPSFLAWLVALERAAVPYVRVTLGSRGPLIAPATPRGDASFQALIVADDAALGALADSDCKMLADLERYAGLRRLIAYAYPTPARGLNPPVWEGPLEQRGAVLTPAGLRIFPYLRGSLAIDPGSWCYAAQPTSGERFETLLAGPDRSALLGIHRQHDGREEMVQTFAANVNQAHGHLLRHGQLMWLTRGTYLGYERNYLPLHIDDVLLGNHAWNVSTRAPDRSREAVIRMTVDDVARAARWSRARGVRLDLGFNGVGSERFAQAAARRADPLLDALVAERDAFGWINHTYEHLNLDDATGATIEAEIERNVSWARRAGLEPERGVLVTGEHTGLANLATTPPRPENRELAAALAAQGIRYLACDASRPYPVFGQDPAGPLWPAGAPFTTGQTLTIPRLPTALPFDAATEAQALDRMRVENPAQVPTTWRDVIATEARRIFVAIVSNDPRPHYFHQSNLTGEGIMYELLDAILDRYALYLKDTPIAQPTLGEVGELLSGWIEWRAALADGSVAGYRDGARVVIVNQSAAPLKVPVTGTAIGTRYGGSTSGWVLASPGRTTLETEAGR